MKIKRLYITRANESFGLALVLISTLLLVSCQPQSSGQPASQDGLTDSATNQGNSQTDQSKATDSKAAALTVNTLHPQMQSLPQAVNANGLIQPWQEAIIGSQLNGVRINRVLVNVGDHVAKGQLLAEFASETLLQDIAMQEAKIREQQAQATLARNTFAMAQKLEAGAISQQQFNQYQTEVQLAEARLESLKAELAQQQIRLRYTRVVAPDAGTIAARVATTGAVMSMGQEMFNLYLQDKMEWRAEVSASLLPQLAKGGKVSLQVDGLAEPLQGEISKFSPKIEQASMTGTVYVSLKNALQAGVKAGMFGRGSFIQPEQMALTVPEAAVLNTDGFSYVFKVKPDATVEKRKITPGIRYQGTLQVLSGLQSADTLVASGVGFLNDGDRVRVQATD